jgi:hypothetical protein
MWTSVKIVEKSFVRGPKVHYVEVIADQSQGFTIS